jgi:predicted transcriptional regulator
MYDKLIPDIVAADIMSPDLTSVTTGTDIADAVDLMLDHEAGTLPVIDTSGALLGMITASTLITRVAGRLAEQPPHWLNTFLFPGAMAKKFAQLHGRKVSEVLDRSLGGISMETPLKRIIERFDETNAERLAVVDCGKVIGVVTRADVLWTMVELYRPRSGARPDSQIREQIVTELARQPWMPRQGVEASVRNGLVDLEGFVLDDNLRLGIKAVVENVPGVKAVRDHLRLTFEGSPGIFVAPENVDDAHDGGRTGFPSNVDSADAPHGSHGRDRRHCGRNSLSRECHFRDG